MLTACRRQTASETAKEKKRDTPLLRPPRTSIDRSHRMAAAQTKMMMTTTTTATNCSRSRLTSREHICSNKHQIKATIINKNHNYNSKQQNGSNKRNSVLVRASAAKIKVIGCGGGGGNAVNRMIEAGVSVRLCHMPMIYISFALRRA